MSTTRPVPTLVSWSVYHETPSAFTRLTSQSCVGKGSPFAIVRHGYWYSWLPGCPSVVRHMPLFWLRMKPWPCGQSAEEREIGMVQCWVGAAVVVPLDHLGATVAGPAGDV